MELLTGINGLNLVCEYLIKSSLVLCFSLLLVFLSRKKSASLRHFLLSFSLISMLLIPFLSSITTGWETRLLPSWQTEENSSSVANEWAKSRRIPIQEKHEDLNFHEENTQHRDIMKTDKADRGSLMTLLAAKINLLGLCLVILWSVGLIFLITRISLGLYGAFRLTRKGEKISSQSWQQLLQRLLKAIPLKRKVRLFSHKQVMFPLTWGVIKPVVIIPDESRKWTKGQCSSALFHELSHIKRGDFLVKMIARISCAIFWFNPLIWITFKMMKKEQEKACDEFVLKAGVRPSTYAANLLSIKKSGQARWNMPAAVLGAVGKSQLNERLNAILKKQIKPKEIKMKTKIMISLTVIFLIIGIGFARPSHMKAYGEKSLSSKDKLPNEISQSIQEENVQEKQKKKEAEKSKKEESADTKDKKKEIKWISKDGSKKTFILKIDGKNFTIKKNKEGCWNIKGDKLEVIKGDEVKVIKINKGNTICIETTDKKDNTIALNVVVPKLHIHKDKKGKKNYMILKKTVHVAPHVDVRPYIHLDSQNEKLKERIKKLRERLQKIKEQEESEAVTEAKAKVIEELEGILKELSKELEKKSNKLKDIHISVHPKPYIKIDMLIKDDKKIKYHIAKEIKGHISIVDIHKEDKVTAFIDKENGIQIIFKGKLDSEQKNKYEEILKKLKKELPESYKVESEINEKENTFTIKITGDEKDEEQKKDLKELIKKIVGEIKKVKDSRDEKKIFKL